MTPCTPQPVPSKDPLLARLMGLMGAAPAILQTVVTGGGSVVTGGGGETQSLYYFRYADVWHYIFLQL